MQSTKLLLAISLLITTLCLVNAQKHAHLKRTRRVLARNTDRWNFSKSCTGARCGCWSDGCWQQIQACFGFDCYLWQCFGANCGCPADICVSGCIGPNCVLEVVAIDDFNVPEHWVWTDDIAHRRRRGRY
jgi:hypothetical protein